MLDVDRGVDVDPGVEQLLDVLVAALVTAAGGVAVASSSTSAPAAGAHQRVEVELFELGLVLDRRRGSTSRPRAEPRSRGARGSRRSPPPRRRPGPSSRAALSMAKVFPTPGAAPRKTFSRPRRSRASSAPTRASSASGSGARFHGSMLAAFAARAARGSAAEVGRSRSFRRRALRHRDASSSSARFSSRTLTLGSPRTPSWRPSMCSSTKPVHRLLGQAARRGDARDLIERRGRGDVRIETAARGGHEIDRNAGLAVRSAQRASSVAATRSSSAGLIGPRLEPADAPPL